MSRATLKLSRPINQIEVDIDENELQANGFVKVIHCKDCRWGKEVCGNIECVVDINIPPEYHGYTWYCPNGERKEE